MDLAAGMGGFGQNRCPAIGSMTSTPFHPPWIRYWQTGPIALGNLIPENTIDEVEIATGLVVSNPHGWVGGHG